MTRIFLTRHGETQWNRQGRLQGHQDSPLTETGRQQAREAARALEGYAIDKVYSSPLQRAHQTAAIITAGRDLDIQCLNDFKELSLGPWEGKTRGETEQSDPQQYHNCWNQQDRFNLKGAETFQQLQRRIVAGLKQIFAQEQGNILVISHWLAIKTALAWADEIPLGELNRLPDMANGQFFIFTKHKGKISVATPDNNLQ